ncbi:YbhB/YbcL family Raf kinase inhibitor-like protein [Oxalobacter formigenes]|uniref:YbhB/YbcL family Raf kinase inhibitor-like protein n=1 Tax=Oxalobacter formigenes TaxID=847 RepID=UPI00241E935F|nr:YbhB/YbcL family Raf kinase inhibitor-like protein [Oxalobacter formigenes]
MTFEITSPVFADKTKMPALYTCEGKNISPPLQWTAPPAGTKSLVLINDDPDAPDPAAPKMTWVHWVLYNLPPEAGSLPEAVQDKDLPKGTLIGTNDRQFAGYSGPCPPIGTHRYFFKLYAMDTVLPDMGNTTKAEVVKKMEGHILAQTEMIGLYVKKENA